MEKPEKTKSNQPIHWFNLVFSIKLDNLICLRENEKALDWIDFSLKNQ